jgi:hypothetical protein
MVLNALTAREKRVYRQFAREHADQLRLTLQALRAPTPLYGLAK